MITYSFGSVSLKHSQHGDSIHKSKKYIFNQIHIYKGDTLIPEIKFKGKDIILTGHIKNELYDIYKKNLDIIFEILSSGTSSKQSKDKTKVLMRTKKGLW